MQLGPYRVGDVLGEGSTGIVYRAVDPQGRELALKVLREELSLSERERSRFLEEATRLRRVRHPALVDVIDAGVLPNGLPYIAMPFLNGASLADRLQRQPMRFDVALHLFEQLADALQTLHRAGLVHRDIKPENIFVTEGDRQAMLLDLGIARDVTAAPSTTTHAGMIRGTPAYMAPERFFGSPATPATDIYELGVVLYVTLVGALPWMRFDDPTERMHPAAPATRGVILPPRLSSTLMRALAMSPGDRPQSAHEFASAVLDALSPESAHRIAGQATSSWPGHPDMFAPTTAAPPAGAARAPGMASGVRPGPRSTRTPALLIAAMTGASLLGAGALALLLFVRGAAKPAEAPQASMEPKADGITAPRPSPSLAAEPEVVAPPAGAAGAAAPTPSSAVARRSAATGAPHRNLPGTSKGSVAPSAIATPSESATGAALGSATRTADAAAGAPARLPFPPPARPASSEMANCKTLATYECSPAVRVRIGVASCNQTLGLVTLHSRSPEVTRSAVDGTCQMKLQEFMRRASAEREKK
jgi:hypothetical protein